MTIRVVCSLYKFIHRTKYLYYNKIFVVGKSIVCLNLFGYDLGISKSNHMVKGEDLVQVMTSFKELCGLPTTHGMIDITYIHILKSKR